MLNVIAFHNGIVVIGVYEVAVIREPAEREDGHHDDKHLHHLQENTNHHYLITLYPFTRNISGT